MCTCQDIICVCIYNVCTYLYMCTFQDILSWQGGSHTASRARCAAVINSALWPSSFTPALGSVSINRQGAHTRNSRSVSINRRRRRSRDGLVARQCTQSNLSSRSNFQPFAGVMGGRRGYLRSIARSIF